MLNSNIHKSVDSNFIKLIWFKKQTNIKLVEMTWRSYWQNAYINANSKDQNIPIGKNKVINGLYVTLLNTNGNSSWGNNVGGNYLLFQKRISVKNYKTQFWNNTLWQHSIFFLYFPSIVKEFNC